MDMIWRTFLKFEGQDYTEEGIQNFYEFITDVNLYRAFQQGRYQLLVALDGEKVIGAASLRNGHHLSLLFVEEAYHHQGVGRDLLEQLCLYLKNEAGENIMTVKSSPYAVGFYRSQGFRQVGPEEAFSGIRVTSMEKTL